MVAVGVLITTIGGVVISVRNSGKLAAVQTQVKAVDGKVNGAATAQVAKIDKLHRQVAKLVASSAEMKQHAALLAQTAPKPSVKTPKPTRKKTP